MDAEKMKEISIKHQGEYLIARYEKAMQIITNNAKLGLRHAYIPCEEGDGRQGRHLGKMLAEKKYVVEHWALINGYQDVLLIKW